MHRSLQIEYLQRLIFRYLSPRDLARLAHTCKAFFDIATDELWKTINSFAPLLACLPQDFQYLYRTLRADDFQRYDFYVAKIQNVILESEAVMVLPPQFRSKPKTKAKRKTWEQFWGEMDKLRPLPASLSNIRHLCISNVGERLLAPLVGISGSNMTQIRIHRIQNKKNPSIVYKLLEALQDTPKLEALFLRDDEVHLADYIRQSPLKHLRLDPRTRCHFGLYGNYPMPYEILQKSMLQSLTLSLTRGWHTPKVTASNGRYLPGLKRLWLNLTAFTPGHCNQSCSNRGVNSWTCESDNTPFNSSLHHQTNCGRRSPSVFLKGLNNPELSILVIKFPLRITAKMFLEVMYAAESSCRLGNLTELVLAGGGWSPNCYGCGSLPRPQIRPADLRMSLSLLLPLPQLKTLRLSVAPNFLDILDLKLYRTITAGLPSLESLTLGHKEFYSYRSGIYYERVPLHHLAAFCTTLRKLKEVSVGTIDGLQLEKEPRKEWACSKVTSLTISNHADVLQRVTSGLLLLGLEVYFPNSGSVQQKVYRRHLFY